MPIYTYRNTETGEEWSDIRKYEDRYDGVDGEKIVLLLPLTRRTDPDVSDKRRMDFHKKVIEPMKKNYYGNNLP